MRLIAEKKGNEKMIDLKDFIKIAYDELKETADILKLSDGNIGDILTGEIFQSEALEDEIYEEVEKWLNANKKDLEEERARIKWERETPEHFKVCEPERL